MPTGPIFPGGPYGPAGPCGEKSGHQTSSAPTHRSVWEHIFSRGGKGDAVKGGACWEGRRNHVIQCVCERRKKQSLKLPALTCTGTEHLYERRHAGIRKGERAHHTHYTPTKSTKKASPRRHVQIRHARSFCFKARPLGQQNRLSRPHTSLQASPDRRWQRRGEAEGSPASQTDN